MTREVTGQGAQLVISVGAQTNTLIGPIFRFRNWYHFLNLFELCKYGPYASVSPTKSIVVVRRL